MARIEAIIPGIENMTTQFDLINNLLTLTNKQMVERLQTNLQQKFDLKYPTFEIFAYLLFQTDYFAATYQDRKIRFPLYDHIADKMLISLGMEKKLFNDTLNKRMEEYGGTMVRWILGEITDLVRTKGIVEGYLRNLAYSIDKQDLFFWEGKVKPPPLLS